jgi:3-polyprenyl-4-hydroxybenzoate decarboxylase
MEAAFRGHTSLKHVVVVDEDVDLFDPAAVEWAIATRFQADRDLVIFEDQPSSSLDPSAVLRADPSAVLRADPSAVLRADPSAGLRADPSAGLKASPSAAKPLAKARTTKMGLDATVPWFDRAGRPLSPKERAGFRKVRYGDLDLGQYGLGDDG